MLVGVRPTSQWLPRIQPPVRGGSGVFAGAGRADAGIAQLLFVARADGKDVHTLAEQKTALDGALQSQVTRIGLAQDPRHRAGVAHVGIPGRGFPTLGQATFLHLSLIHI